MKMEQSVKEKKLLRIVKKRCLRRSHIGSKAELGTTIVVTPWLGGGVAANDSGPNCLANAPPAHAHTR